VLLGRWNWWPSKLHVDQQPESIPPGPADDAASVPVGDSH
jgi:hypothetical protein